MGTQREISNQSEMNNPCEINKQSEIRDKSNVVERFAVGNRDDGNTRHAVGNRDDGNTRRAASGRDDGNTRRTAGGRSGKMYQTRILKHIAQFLCTTVVLLAAVAGLSLAMLPTVSDFYKEDHYDVVFFGTSHAYCTFDPKVFAEYGLTTYNRGLPQQTMDCTYYMVKDALESADIDVVVLESYAMIYDEGSEMMKNPSIKNDAFMAMSGLTNRYELVQNVIPEKYQRSYYFPLDKFHNGWETWNYSSLASLVDSIANPYVTDPERGYHRLQGSIEMGYMSWEQLVCETEADIYGPNWYYLNQIKKVCDDHGATLILAKSPYPAFDGAVEVCRSMDRWCANNEVDFVNFMLLTQQIGFGYGADTVEGEHLNESGASKVSHYMAEYILEKQLTGEVLAKAVLRANLSQVN